MKKFETMLLASDLDGTLLNSNKEITLENKEAISDFINQGGIFTIATGRNLQGLKKYADQLVVNAPVIALNGAAVYDLDDNLIDFIGMPLTAPQVILDVMQRFEEVGIEVYLPDKLYIIRSNSFTERHMRVLKLSFEEAALSSLPPSNAWCKVNFTTDPALMGRLRDYALATYKNEFSFTHSSPHFFEMTHVKANKGDALLKLAKRLNISKKHVFSVGDNYNDASMLKQSAIAFVPDNAVQEIKEMGDIIVANHNEHALANTIEYLHKYK